VTPSKFTWRRVLGLVVAVLVAAGGYLVSNGGGDEAPERSAPRPSASASVTTSAGPTSAGPTSAGPTSSAAAPTSSAAAPTSSSTGLPAVDEHGLPYIHVNDLPDEAFDTLVLISDGGPFPEDEDGSRFGNYEGVLPDRPSGYYAEYTVYTPGVSHRGARRIVAGDGGELYYTDDHYATFSRIGGWDE